MCTLRIFDEYERLHAFESRAIYNICVRVVSDIQSFAFGSSLYIRYNAAVHVVNSTCICVYVYTPVDKCSFFFQETSEVKKSISSGDVCERGIISIPQSVRSSSVYIMCWFVLCFVCILAYILLCLTLPYREPSF